MVTGAPRSKSLTREMLGANSRQYQAHPVSHLCVIYVLLASSLSHVCDIRDDT